MKQTKPAKRMRFPAWTLCLPAVEAQVEPYGVGRVRGVEGLVERVRISWGSYYKIEAADWPAAVGAQEVS